MEVLAFILALIATALFVVAFIQSNPTNLAAGLAVLVVAWIVDLTVTGTIIH